MIKLIKKYEMFVEEQVVLKGDMIRINTQPRKRFMFMCTVTNPENGVQWIDCIELMKGGDGPFRSFRPEQVRLPKGKKRGAAKRV